MDSFGTRLRMAREACGMSQELLAEKVNIGKSTISDYENDKKDPKMPMACALAKELNTPVAFLAGEDGEMHHDEQNPDVKELLKLVNGLSSEEFQLVLGSVENMVRFANLKKRVV